MLIVYALSLSLSIMSSLTHLHTHTHTHFKQNQVPVGIALLFLRATIAFENLFDLRPQEELEEAISRAATDATARDRKGKTLSVGDRVRSRWMGGTRWWNGKIAAVLTASSVDVQYDDGDFETGVNSHQFVELVIEDSAPGESTSSSSLSTESWWLWFGRPVVQNLILGEERFNNIPSVEADDVVRFVLVCFVFIGLLVVGLVSAGLQFISS